MIVGEPIVERFAFGSIREQTRVRTAADSVGASRKKGDRFAGQNAINLVFGAW